MLLDEKFFLSLSNMMQKMEKEHYLGEIEKEKKTYLSPEIRIGMWGQFSSGKSSLINALVSRDVLPVNIAETTAMVTEISYGEIEEIIINPAGENVSFLYSKALAAIILTGNYEYSDLKSGIKNGFTEGEFNEALKKVLPFRNKIEKVSVKIPCDLLKTGIVFVDLPGVKGSKNKEVLAQARIQDCEIILWLKAADRPADKYDWEVINMLKAEGQKRVVFAVRTKSDDMFKTFYAEGSSKLSEEEIYQKLKGDLKHELKEANFDDVFLMSPIAYEAMLKTNGDNKEARDFLRKNHANKFRFLKEGADVGVISGHSHFSKEFFGAIEKKKYEAKLRRVQGSVSILASKIGQEIDESWRSLERTKSMDTEEHKLHEVELTRIREDFLKLKDVRSKINNTLEGDLNRFINENYQQWIKQALASCSQNENDYQDVDDVIQNISTQVSSTVSNKMKDEMVKKRIHHILQNSLDIFKKDVSSIEDQIREFSQQLFHEDESSSITSLIGSTEDIMITAKARYGESFQKDGASGGAGAIAGIMGSLALDTSMDFMLEGALGIFGGFGIGTAIRGAWKGSKNGDGAIVGIANSFANMADGIMSFWGSATDNRDLKSNAEIRLILRRMASPGERDGFSKTIYSETYQNFGSNLKTNLLEEITTKVKNQKIIEMIEMRLHSQQKNLQNLFKSKSMDIEEKKAEIKKISGLRDEYLNILNEYEIFNPNGHQKKAA